MVAFLAAGLVSSCTTYAFTGATRTADLTPEVIARRINEVRLASGVKAWTYNSRLADAAREQVGLMVAKNTLSHDLGVTLRERVTRAGYDGAVGENVAKGYPTLEGASRAG